MTDESKLHEAATRGARAKQELSELRTAFDTLAQAYYKAWASSSAADVEGRERLFIAAQIVGIVETNLRHVVDNGRIAESEIAAISEPSGNAA